jgi:tRNA(Leu) C34 or U34 (ribose-2'-O)-methylase TrmL
MKNSFHFLVIGKTFITIRNKQRYLKFNVEEIPVLIRKLSNSGEKIELIAENGYNMTKKRVDSAFLDYCLQIWLQEVENLITPSTRHSDGSNDYL